VRLNNRDLGSLGHRAAELVHRACKSILGHKSTNILFGELGVDQREECKDIISRVDNRRCSKKPLALCYNTRDRIVVDLRNLGGIINKSSNLLNAEAVGLIADIAVKDDLRDRVNVNDKSLIADHVDVGAIRKRGRNQLPALGAKDEHVDAALDRGILPLVDDSKREDKKSLLVRRMLNEAQHLNGLAETHLVTQETPAGLSVGLTLNHPIHAILLMGLVREVGPQRLKSGCCHFSLLAS